MKTYSFPTCKGVLKIAAESRQDALSYLRFFARRNKRNEYVPVGAERMKKYKRILYGTA